MYLDALNSLSITAFQGARVGSITTWFEELCRLNELMADSLSYNVDAQQLSGRASKHTMRTLVDQGASGCVAGGDCKRIGGPVTPRHVSITGIDNHQLRNIPIGTVGAYAVSN